jgi:periplasmic protein TonB
MKRLKMAFLGVFCFSSLFCTTQIYTIVEQQPEYPQGQAALFKYLSQNIKYPAIWKDNGLEGSMFVSFVVEEDGSITHVTCRRGCDNKEFTELNLKVIRDMPKWKVGRQNGKAVRVAYSLPIKIHLE